MGLPVADMWLDDREGLQGLTGKQYQLALAIFGGMSATAAYVQVYDADPTNPAVGQTAHQMAHNPKVQAKLRELRERTDSQASLVPVITREWITDGIARLATSASTDSVKLRAYELLGKTTGIDMFREHSITERAERTTADIDAELKQRLQALMPTIEGVARATPPDTTLKPAPLASRPDRRRKPGEPGK